MDIIYYITAFLTTLGMPALIIGIILALIKPTLLNKSNLVKNPLSRKKIAAYGAAGFLATTVGFGSILSATEPESVRLDRIASEEAKSQALQLQEKQKLEEQKKITEAAERKKRDESKPVVKTETKTQSIAFESTEQNDPNLPVGEKKLGVQGVDGERKIIYEVTYVNGKETARRETKNEITKQPVAKVTLIGTYSKPSPAPAPTQTYVAPPSSSGSVYYKNCTAVKAAGVAPIYAGQPGYGSHLDRDNDGVACEK